VTAFRCAIFIFSTRHPHSLLPATSSLTTDAPHLSQAYNGHPARYCGSIAGNAFCCADLDTEACILRDDHYICGPAYNDHLNEDYEGAIGSGFSGVAIALLCLTLATCTMFAFISRARRAAYDDHGGGVILERGIAMTPVVEGRAVHGNPNDIAQAVPMQNSGAPSRHTRNSVRLHQMQVIPGYDYGGSGSVGVASFAGEPSQTDFVGGMMGFGEECHASRHGGYRH
jgi:hypothetical protein